MATTFSLASPLFSDGLLMMERVSAERLKARFAFKPITLLRLIPPKIRASYEPERLAAEVSVALSAAAPDAVALLLPQSWRWIPVARASRS